MTSTQPETNMVGKLVDLVNEELPDDVNTDRTIIANSQDVGKGRDLSTYDYIEMSLTSPLGIEYADLFRSTQNVDTVVFVELKASTEERRDELFDAFRSVIEDHGERPDTPGDHDRMDLEDITPMDDDAFGAFVTEMVVAFYSRSRDKD